MSERENEVKNPATPASPKIKTLNEKTRPMNSGKTQLVPPTESDGDDDNGICGLPCKSAT